MRRTARSRANRCRSASVKAPRLSRQCLAQQSRPRAATAELERLSRTIYAYGASVTAKSGIIIADTKFEFGRTPGGEIILIDEVMTPDSSRFWPAGRYKPGGPQPSFDKQPLRDYLGTERRAGRWSGEAPPPPLAPDIIAATSERYRDAFHRITGTAIEGLCEGS
jgi:phosphoribosylaminoimidazole-succinocarboxamide synthase